MANSRVGQLVFQKDEGGFGDKPYSEATAEAIDEEAREIVNQAYERTLNLIRERKEEVQKVTDLLLSKETITHDDLVDLIGNRPFKGDTQYQEYVSKRNAMEKEGSIEQDVPKDEAEIENESGFSPGMA